MKLTVRDILQFKVFQEAVLLAGASGIDREVAVANIVSTPNIAKFLKGKELLIASGFTFMDSPRTGVNLVHALAEKNVSALSLRPDAYMEKVPEDIIDACDSCGLPLLLLPASVPYIDFMMPIFEAIINSRYVTLKNTGYVYNTIIDMILAGKNLTDICALLGDILSHTLSIVDKSGVFLTRDEENLLPGCKAEIAYIISYIKNLSPPYSRVFPLDPVPCTRYSHAVPLVTSTGLDGYVLVQNSAEPLTEYAVSLLEQAAPLIALEIIKSNIIFETEKQLRGELLDYLLFTEAADTALAQRWAADMNFTFRSRMQIWKFCLRSRSDYTRQSVSRLRDAGRTLRNAVQNDISFCFQHSAHSVLVTEHNGSLILLLSWDGPVTRGTDYSSGSLERILDQLNGSHDFPARVSVGLGRPVDAIRLLPRSLSEAETALQIGQVVRRSWAVYPFESLGAYAVMHNLKGNSFSRDFVRSNLEGVMQYDTARGELLLETLELYFSNDCNYEKTAAALDVHRNTVVYRIKKIEELTGQRLANRTQSFHLQLSLVLYRSAFPDLFGETE